MMNTQRAMVSADIAVYRQQTTKFTILAATAEIDKVVSFISDARGLFRSEMNKQSLGMIVDCDDGPENHSHPEIIRHPPKPEGMCANSWRPQLLRYKIRNSFSCFAAQAPPTTQR